MIIIVRIELGKCQESWIEKHYHDTRRRLLLTSHSIHWALVAGGCFFVMSRYKKLKTDVGGLINHYFLAEHFPDIIIKTNSVTKNWYKT